MRCMNKKTSLSEFLVSLPCGREVGTIAYRSGPEWAQRFGHKRRDKNSPPDFCQDFEIEYYLDKQVRIILIMVTPLLVNTN